MHLGTVAKDKVTGFTGVITAWCEYKDALPRAQLERLDPDGKLQSEWFDAARLEAVPAA